MLPMRRLIHDARDFAPVQTFVHQTPLQAMDRQSLLQLRFHRFQKVSVRDQSRHGRQVFYPKGALAGLALDHLAERLQLKNRQKVEREIPGETLARIPAESAAGGTEEVTCRDFDRPVSRA